MLLPEELRLEARPRAAGRARRLGVLSGVGFAAAALWRGGREAFAGSTLVTRPAGNFVVVEKLPEGATCRAAYGDRDAERPDWDPYPQWRGEASYHPARDLQADVNRQWYHFDAEGKVLGNIAQHIALTLRGKNSPLYDPIRDVGAFVVVTNCEKVRVSGKKYHFKLYFRNLSHRPGHMIVERFKDLQKRFPERIIMHAVWGSMPKTPSSRRIFKERLHLFAGPNHLYYDKNPVEYPMHLIKDCTPSLNMPRNMRVVHWMSKAVPYAVKAKAAIQKDADARKLRKFKKFLLTQLETDGPEATERMTMDELAEKAERERLQEVLDANVGKELPTRSVKMYPGTQFPRRRVST